MKSPKINVLVVCNSGVRSYEALRQLETAGLTNDVNLQGGIAALKKIRRPGPQRFGGTI